MVCGASIHAGDLEEGAGLVAGPTRTGEHQTKLFARVSLWGLRFLYEGRQERIQPISDAMFALNHDCVELYRHHLAGTGHDHLLQDSWYVHAFRDASQVNLSSPDYAMRKAVGAEIEQIGAAELRKLEPSLTHDFEAAVLIKGQARAVSPGKIGEVLAEKLLAMGGIIERAKVLKISPQEDGSWTYVTEQGEHSTPKLVLSMGVWSAELLKPLGIKIPMEAERGYHVSFDNPGVSLCHSVMDMDMKFVASSMEDAIRVAGTAEFAGLDAPINQKRLDALVALASKLLPDLNTTQISTWSGQRPSLPDSLPCIGQIDGFQNLIGAFGHSHYG